MEIKNLVRDDEIVVKESVWKSDNLLRRRVEMNKQAIGREPASHMRKRIRRGVSPTENRNCNKKQIGANVTYAPEAI